MERIHSEASDWWKWCHLHFHWRETVVKFVRASMCVPLSDCPWSYLSVWLHNNAAFTLLRRFYSANHIQSAQHTVSVHVHGLARTPSLYLCFSLTNCFVIYVAFLKPLSSGWAGHDGPLSLHKIIELGSCTRKWPSANTQNFNFRQNGEYFAKYMCTSYTKPTL